MAESGVIVVSVGATTSCKASCTHADFGQAVKSQPIFYWLYVLADILDFYRSSNILIVVKTHIN